MITYNYFCENCTCGAEPGTKTFQIELEPKEAKKKQMCPNFNGAQNKKKDGVLKLLGQMMSTGLLKFSGKTMTLDQKSAMLKKRSTAHYNSEIKDRKHEKWKQAFGRGDEKPNNIK